MTTSKNYPCTSMENNEKLIYVGPNLPDSKLTKYTVFVGGYPSWLEDEFNNETYGEELKRLFVPINRLPKAQQEILIKGKPLNKYYRKVIENM